MKKLSITMCLLMAMIFVYGQKKEKNNAYSHYLNGYYDRAKEAIDRAILNDETKTDATVWMYRGNIYLQLANSKEKEYKNLCNNCAEVAFEAYFKALELDPKVTVSMNITNPSKGLEYCAGFLYDEARVLYSNGKYEEAYSVIEKAHKADENNEDIMYLMALIAEVTKRTDVTKSCYGKLVRKKTKNIVVYARLANIYRMENDTTKAVNTMSAGAPMFLDDTINVDYAIAYSIILSWAGKTDEATEVMDKALEKYPDNHILLINYGSELTNGKNYTQAEKYLKRALELQPNELTALYNLGNCYYNSYVDKKNSLNDIEDNDEAERLRIEYLKLLEQARPYLEKAHEMDSKDRNTLIMLRTIYSYLNLKDEGKAVDEKLNALGK